MGMETQEMERKTAGEVVGGREGEEESWAEKPSLPIWRKGKESIREWMNERTNEFMRQLEVERTDSTSLFVRSSDNFLISLLHLLSFLPSFLPSSI
mmetsp:Transcript_54236/g.106108  ORF Transcript_54236/g.106108 Transcript_54236/m.106108 type:complete len:96 (-) Transcript_54236:1302-1589(-)